MGVKVVISQSMYFPWTGMLEQIQLADVFVHYDDVAFSKGSFTNRVQLKTEQGSTWMTIPLSGLKLGQPINQVSTKPFGQWTDSHRGLLKSALGYGPHFEQALAVFNDVIRESRESLGEVSRRSMLALAGYFGLLDNRMFIDAEQLNCPGTSSQRVLDIVKEVGGTTYITGHGARKYLDHDLFEKNGIEVQYMIYENKEYPQMFGDFTPYVSALDLIANMGVEGKSCIAGRSEYWKNFIQEKEA
jgi:hypothetical protein